MDADNYEFYRATSIGDALIETLNGMVTANQISGALAVKILHNFDSVLPRILATEVKATTMVKGKIGHYNRIDEVRRFVLKTAKFMTKENGLKDEVWEITAENITVLMCPSKKS